MSETFAGSVYHEIRHAELGTRRQLAGSWWVKCWPVGYDHAKWMNEDTEQLISDTAMYEATVNG